MKISMNESILNVINAVVDYGRFIYTNNLVVKDPAFNGLGQMEQYYFSLPLPDGMNKNEEDFETILAIGWYSGRELEKLNTIKFHELEKYNWKNF